jgi:hypothetical protein
MVTALYAGTVLARLAMTYTSRSWATSLSSLLILTQNSARFNGDAEKLKSLTKDAN